MKCKPTSFRLACPKLDSGNPGAAEAPVMLMCKIWAASVVGRVINPRSDSWTGWSAENQQAVFPSITFYIPPLRHCQSLEDPKSSLHSRHCTFQEVSWGHPALCYFLSLSLNAASCSFSFLLLPFPSCSHYSCTRQLPPPTSPHPQISAFNTLFSSRWLFSAPGTKDTSGRKAVTLSSAALSEWAYVCCIKGGRKKPPANPSFRSLHTSHLLADHSWEKSGLLQLTLPGVVIRSCIYSLATILMLFCICCTFT